MLEEFMSEAKKVRMVGFNHIALEVGDVEEALAFYGRLFDFGDQFLALQKGRTQSVDDGRHFGLVVDSKESAREALIAAGVHVLPGPFLDFLDPWGNRI